MFLYPAFLPDSNEDNGFIASQLIVNNRSVAVL